MKLNRLNFFIFILMCLSTIILTANNVFAQPSTVVEVIGGDITADARVRLDNCPEPVMLWDHETDTAIIDPILPVSANTLAEANQGGCHALVESAVDFDPSDFLFIAGSTLEIFSESTYSAIASMPEASINFSVNISGSLNFLAETAVNFSGSSRVVVTITESSSSTEVLRLIWDGSASYSVPFNVINGEIYNLKLSTNFTEHSIGSTHSFSLAISINESNAMDADEDGVADLIDNCLNVSNPDQADRDSDFIGDVCDPFPDDRDNEQAQCEVDLADCLENPLLPDADADGEADLTDHCPDTPPNTEVDSDGCSLWQFCTAIDTSSHHGRKICNRSDWENDEPLNNKGDCKAVQQGKGSSNYLCIPR